MSPAPIRVLGIAGSLRRGSYNRAALRAATTLVPEGATLETFDLEGIPGFNEDDEGTPPARVVELKRSIRAADAVLSETSGRRGGSTTCGRSSSF
jgi:chromate reductase, NAD(P)H dehydrogenase (quinone)